MKVAMLPKSGIWCEGGLATYLRNIIPGLVQKGHKLVLYTPDPRDVIKKNFPGIEHVTIAGGHSTIDERLEAAVSHVLKAREREDIDVFHVHNLEIALYTEMLKASEKKIILTHHGSMAIRPDATDLQAQKAYREYLSLSNISDSVVVHSLLVYEQFNKFDANLSLVNAGTKILSEITAQEILQLGLEPQKYLLFVGKLKQEKGPDIIVDAYKRLKTNFPLVIVGTNSGELDYFQRLTESTGSDSRVILLGEVLGRKKHELFSNAYLVINPLKIMGLPLVVLEAMGHGKCVLNSDLSTHHEAIKRYAHLFKNNDSESLRQELEFLLDNPEYIRARGLLGREYVREHHSWDTVIDLYDRLYRA